MRFVVGLRRAHGIGGPTPGILISYRRADTAGHAGRLYDTLAARFGEDGVFMDIAGIAIGEDFVAAIEHEVAGSDVVLVLIGPDWVSMSDESGRRRLDDPADFVVLEIAAALERETPVIPVLVEGARMPGAAELPPRIAALARRNALELSDGRWRYDTGVLIERIEALAAPEAPPAARPSPAAARRSVPGAVWIAAAVLVIGAIVLGLVLSGGGGGGDDGGGPGPSLADEPLAVAPESIDFGALTVGEESDPVEVRITNSSAESFVIDSFAWDPETSTDFQRDDTACVGADIDPGGDGCVVLITFTPSEAGPRETTLVIVRLGSEVTPRRVVLTGEGQ